MALSYRGKPMRITLLFSFQSEKIQGKSGLAVGELLMSREDEVALDPHLTLFNI